MSLNCLIQYKILHPKHPNGRWISRFDLLQIDWQRSFDDHQPQHCVKLELGPGKNFRRTFHYSDP